MREHSTALAGVLVGAVIGGLAGYMVLTPGGRALCRQLEPALDELEAEVGNLRQTVQRTARIASEGWSLLTEMAGEGI